MSSIKNSIKVIFEDAGQDPREILTRGKETLLTIALENDIPISHSCGGMGSCGTCLVKVLGPTGENRRVNDALSKPNLVEREIASDRGYLPNERLACQCYPQKNVHVQICFPDDD